MLLASVMQSSAHSAWTQTLHQCHMTGVRHIIKNVKVCQPTFSHCPSAFM